MGRRQNRRRRIVKIYYKKDGRKVEVEPEHVILEIGSRGTQVNIIDFDNKISVRVPMGNWKIEVDRIPVYEYFVDWAPMNSVPTTAGNL